MKKTKLIPFLFLVFATTAICQNSDIRLLDLDKDIEALISKYNAVGLSVAIVEGDSILYSKGFGYRDKERGLAMNPETLLPIGSATKSFTSTVLGIYEEKGKLSLKDRPAKYISGLEFYNNEMDHLITIEDLLCHRSGMGSFDGSNTFFPTDDPKEFVPRLKHLKPNGEIKNCLIEFYN